MGKILWLASYPRSGNTWLRAFLDNLLHESRQPSDVNALLASIASHRATLDDVLGVETSDLTPDEIRALQPKAYRHLASVSKDTLYLKIHDALTQGPDGFCSIPADASLGVIYLIRNPLDVTVSFAHFSASSLDQAITILAEDTYTLASYSKGLPEQVPQKISSWSGHVLSWADQQIVPKILVRYEDMVNAPLETFTRISRFAGLSTDPVRVQKAIQFSSFEILQNQEQESGFVGKPPLTKAFFRKGRVGSWHDELMPAQRDRILDRHRLVMSRFGYLTVEGRIVY
jgi:aryl sulfotransferase